MGSYKTRKYKNSREHVRVVSSIGVGTCRAVGKERQAHDIMSYGMLEMPHQSLLL